MHALIFALLSAGCTSDPADSGGGGDSTSSEGYSVAWTSTPAPLLPAEAGQFTERILLDGQPIPDLQRNHERYVHTVFVSRDLESFTHAHMEDTTDITADDIRASTFTFPLTLPTSGDYLVAFDYAHHDQWLQSTDWLTVGGNTPQLSEPRRDLATTATSGDLVVTLTWDVAAPAGFESIFTIHITTSEGEDVTDLTPWLGADGHVVLVDEALDWISHTHAWFPDMGNMTPTMAMPHLYPGPDLPFHYSFPTEGTYKLWVQFVRASAPETVHAVPFSFVVAG
jgi:hypothetical protein